MSSSDDEVLKALFNTEAHEQGVSTGVREHILAAANAQAIKNKLAQTQHLAEQPSPQPTHNHSNVPAPHTARTQYASLLRTRYGIGLYAVLLLIAVSVVAHHAHSNAYPIFTKTPPHLHSAVKPQLSLLKAVKKIKNTGWAHDYSTQPLNTYKPETTAPTH